MIYIDTGHGLGNTGNPKVFDPGTTSPFGKEAEIVRAVAAKLLPKLKALGIDALMAPDGSISSRMAWQAKTLTKGDLFVSLHMNSGNFSGTSVFYASDKTYLHDEACLLSAHIARTLGLKDEGGKPDTATAVKRVGVLHANKDANGFLLELSRIGHEAGVKVVLEKGADAIAGGLAQLLGVSATPPLTAEEQAAWDRMRTKRVYSEFTRPTDIIDAKKLAVFLDRLIP